MKIKTAQDELQRLQNLRKQEEEKLQRIRDGFEEEERVRRQLQLQEPME